MQQHGCVGRQRTDIVFSRDNPDRELAHKVLHRQGDCPACAADTLRLGPEQVGGLVAAETGFRTLRILVLGNGKELVVNFGYIFDIWIVGIYIRLSRAPIDSLCRVPGSAVKSGSHICGPVARNLQRHRSCFLNIIGNKETYPVVRFERCG